MPIQILMPALSPTMTEGALSKWLKKPGDSIRAGDPIAEIETDKASMEVEAVEEGTLDRYLVPAGTTGVAVGTPIALLREEGETIAPSPVAKPSSVAEPTPVVSAPTVVSRQTGAALSDGKRVCASPLARRLAQSYGLDLSRLVGSGPNGRVIKADVESARAQVPAVIPAAPIVAPGVAPGIPVAAPTPAVASANVAAPVASPSPQHPKAVAPAEPDARVLAEKLGMRYKAQPNSGMRKVIARRLSESKQTVPHFYVTIDCQVDRLLAVREELNARSSDYKLSVNDFVIRAIALALRKKPQVNASWTEDAILLYDHADISVAVSTPGGLITPIIRQAETKGLADISNEMKELAKRARDGKLKPEEFQGGSFSISNLGMYGVREFSAIINPPQACLLAVGAAEQRPVVRDGALAVATVMTCTLSIDHRVVDGALGAEFMAVFKKLIEDPLTMLL
ncbi:Dihydrolipoyllysine-residue acetyltransferase component of pyruvate dehydrogenase complex [Azospirillaceae bacterium]